MNRPGARALAIMMLCACLAWAGLARPALGAEPHAPIQALAARLPISVKGVVVVRSPLVLRERVLKSPPGALLARLDVLAPIEEPWSILARELERTPTQLVDDLMGGGAAAILLEDADTDDGVLLAGLVTPETADRLRAKLQATPATVVAGQPLLTFERGRLSMIVRPSPVAHGERTFIVIVSTSPMPPERWAPAAAMIGPGLGEPTISTLPEWTDACARAGDVLALWREEASGSHALWSTLSATIEPKRWRAHLSIAGGTPSLDLPTGHLIDSEYVERMTESGALLAAHVAGGSQVAPPSESPPDRGAQATADNAARAASATGRVQGFHISDECAVAAWGDGQGSGALRVLAAMKSPNDSTADFLDSIAQTVLRAAGDTTSLPMRILGDIGPPALRRTRMQLAQGAPGNIAFGTSPALTWGYVDRADTPDHRWAVMACAPATSAMDATVIRDALPLAHVHRLANDREYLLRLRSRPRQLILSLSPAASVLLMDLNIVHGLSLDLWRAPAPAGLQRLTSAPAPAADAAPARRLEADLRVEWGAF